ncbi:hypothetical protein A6302_04292 [Methylobrevis pamukkalensis]|uniref:Uncharacterized protein n=1 Tax=Methylobrevis pamukkalensis TaxID=1439726 RepID=A0A1E3GWH8_9HYPH|nr:hypothetical protein A6302_04292 [Methylobrevis pamukkalensis]
MPLRRGGIVPMASLTVRVTPDTAIPASAALWVRSDRIPTMITLCRRCGTPKSSARTMKSEGCVASRRLALPSATRMARSS